MEQKGVLVVAHGSRKEEWVAEIDRAVSVLRGLPVEVGFLEKVPGRDMASALFRLKEQGVSQVEVIPLFVSSASTHLVEVRYALGLEESCPEESDWPVINHGLTLHWHPPLDDHPLVVELILDRIAPLSRDPSQESVLLVAHGSSDPQLKEKWQVMLGRLAQAVSQRGNFRQVEVATIIPATIRSKTKELAEQGEVIVIPLFISPGFYTQTYIPRQFKGLNVRYSGETYLPHPCISHWLVQEVNR